MSEPSDPWQRLRGFTQARIGLERHGHAISTAAMLELQLAHAQARDAVWRPWDFAALVDRLKAIGEESLVVATRIANRSDYLQRPDLGRLLSDESRRSLASASSNGAADLVFIMTDGLSAKAIDSHFVDFWQIFAPQLASTGLRHAPIVLAPFGRVGLSDAVGAARNARLVVMFVGERPGLSSNDSMGIYLTYDPKPGNHDANRNCISNVRPPEGLSYELASYKLLYLIQESLRLKLSGVGLKEDAIRSIDGASERKALRNERS